MSPPQSTANFLPTMGHGSAAWTRTVVSKVWADTADKQVCFYISDGGGEVFLMVDPDFHHHYDAPTPACPNVDAFGNCLGVWYWQPPNARHEVFSTSNTGIILTTVTIPASVVAGLAPGLHKLVLTSTDQADCYRQGHPENCPPDVRASWTTVSVLPFKVV